MLSLSDNDQADVVEAFTNNSTSSQIYPIELQLNKANSSDNEAPFLYLHWFITNGIIFSKVYDKRTILILK